MSPLPREEQWRVNPLPLFFVGLIIPAFSVCDDCPITQQDKTLGQFPPESYTYFPSSRQIANEHFHLGRLCCDFCPFHSFNPTLRRSFTVSRGSLFRDEGSIIAWLERCRGYSAVFVGDTSFLLRCPLFLHLLRRHALCGRNWLALLRLGGWLRRCATCRRLRRLSSRLILRLRRNGRRCRRGIVVAVDIATAPCCCPA